MVRILIVENESDDLIRLNTMIKWFGEIGCQVGIMSNNLLLNEIIEDCKVDHVGEEDSLEGWDCILILNKRTLIDSAQIIRENDKTPVIYLSKTTASGQQCGNFKGLFRYLKTSKSIPHYEYGISDELTEIIKIPGHTCMLPMYKKKMPLNFLLVLDKNEEYVDLKGLISAVNMAEKINLDIYSENIEKYYEKYSSICNENIKFNLKTEKDLLIYKAADYVIGNGKYGIEALLYGKPFFMIKQNGMLNFITPENYKFNELRNFVCQNKHNLASKEDICNEINSTIVRNDIKRIVKKNMELAEPDYAPEINIKKIKIIIENVIKLSKMINDSDKLMLLKPKIMKNCTVQRYINKKYMIRRQPVSKNIAIITEKMKELIDLFDGKKTISDIMKEVKCTKQKDVDIMNQSIRKLWDAKIINLMYK